MVHLVTKTTLRYLDVNNEFNHLRFEQIIPALADILVMSEVELEEKIESINPKRTLNAIPIHTKFGYTTMDNIPTGVKSFVFLKLRLYDESKFIIPEFLMGRLILRQVLTLAETEDYTLFSPEGEFSSISLETLENPIEWRVTVNGEEVTRLC